MNMDEFLHSAARVQRRVQSCVCLSQPVCMEFVTAVNISCRAVLLLTHTLNTA